MPKFEIRETIEAEQWDGTPEHAEKLCLRMYNDVMWVSQANGELACVYPEDEWVEVPREGHWQRVWIQDQISGFVELP